MFKQYYDRLELPDNSSDDIVKKQYKKLAILFHPDKNTHKSEKEKNECEKRFKEISEAYEILTNKEKYNNNINFNNVPQNFNINPHDIFSQIFNQSNNQSSININFGGNIPNIVQKTTSIKMVNGKKVVTIIQNINGNISKQEFVSN